MPEEPWKRTGASGSFGSLLATALGAEARQAGSWGPPTYRHAHAACHPNNERHVVLQHALRADGALARVAVLALLWLGGLGAGTAGRSAAGWRRQVEQTLRRKEASCAQAAYTASHWTAHAPSPGAPPCHMTTAEHRRASRWPGGMLQCTTAARSPPRRCRPTPARPRCCRCRRRPRSSRPPPATARSPGCRPPRRPPSSRGCCRGW